MRALLQRVQSARVEIDLEIVGQIGQGWLILMGVGQGDTSQDVDFIIDRVIKMRAFADENGKMNKSITEVQGSVLVVSQFTLYADTKSRRPGFTAAAHPDLAKSLYEEACNKFRQANIPTETGIFAADMQVILQNDGPVTFWIDSRAGE